MKTLMNKRLILVLSIITLLTLSCQSAAPVISLPSSHAAPLILVTQDPNAPPTSTPFQPIAPTPTRILTKAPAFTATPLKTSTPTIPPAISTSAPPAGLFNILVLGSDYRPTSGFRTDTILLVSINPSKGTVSAISFPRDLYVNIPGYGQERLNTAEARGGFRLMADTFQANFGVRPQYYVMTNMQGFVNIVDSLGGIEVNAAQRLTDKCKLPIARGGYCTVGPGKVKMDGQTALWYVRSRYSTSDFDRTRRAQEVVLAMFYKMMSLNVVTRTPELYNQFRKNVETNLSLADIVSLIPTAVQVSADPSRIHRYAIGGGETIPYITPGGASVLLPRQDLIISLIQRALRAQ